MTWRGFGLHRHPWYAREGREQTEEEKQAMTAAKITVAAPMPEPKEEQS